MRKIFVTMFISLDGVVQGPGAPKEDSRGGFEYGGWVVPYSDEATGNAVGETYGKKFDLLLGRKTYDIWVKHWPKVASGTSGASAGEVEFGKKIDDATKYVATHRPESLSWKNTESLGTDIVARLREIKESDGPTLMVAGSANLVRTLLEHDLVDEMQLFTYPVILGKGFKIFGENSHPSSLKMTESKISSKGVIIATYKRDGEVRTGDFTPPGM